MDIQVALKSLEGFELRVAEFFAWLGEVHADDAEASLVFHHMFLLKNLGNSGMNQRCLLCDFGTTRGYLTARPAPCPAAEARAACQRHA